MPNRIMTLICTFLCLSMMFAGCTEEEIPLVTIEDIRNNPDHYNGSKVTVRGYYDQGNLILPEPNTSSEILDSGLRIIKMYIGDMELIHLKEYYFTGEIMKFGIFPWQEKIYVGINVTKAEAIEVS